MSMSTSAIGGRGAALGTRSGGRACVRVRRVVLGVRVRRHADAHGREAGDARVDARVRQSSPGPQS
jgi:hypothetical protein